MHAAIRTAAQPLKDPGDVQPLVDFIGDASIVLLGEATHGTQEFYALRAHLTRALIEERGFTAVAIEGDWPDAWQVNRFVRGDGEFSTAARALEGFERFPTWMWRNTAVTDFITWLRGHNRAVGKPEREAGFYGLDLYSLYASMRAVIEYLDKKDPKAASAARRSYSCFEEYGEDTETYAWAAAQLGSDTCEEAVARQLVELRQKRADLLAGGGKRAADEFFYAEQNARLARNAEKYYRAMFQGRTRSWNVRDEHMAETLDELLRHLKSRGQQPKVVVWAHNSHLGDARATEPGEQGQLNLGQLVRQRHGDKARLIGMTTYSGTVVAADDWGAPARLMQVQPALPTSIEAVFHETGISRFLLPLRKGTEVHAHLDEPRLERAIGVIYRPDTERRSHYFHARLASQFDAVVHFDETRGLEPLEQYAPADPEEVPETYPTGM